jgi:integrating conjugative element protein (TIGR03749 family)
MQRIPYRRPCASYQTVLRSAVLVAALAALNCAIPTRAQQVQDLNPQGVPPDLVSPDAPASAASLELNTGQTQQVPLAQQPGKVAQTRTARLTGSADGAASATEPVQPPSPQQLSVDLGQNLDQSTAAAPADDKEQAGFDPAPASGVAARAAREAQTPPRSAKPRLRRADLDADSAAGSPERVVFERAPVRVPLPVGRERLVTLPAAAALRVPADMDQVAAIQNIDRTLYVKAKVAFSPIRIVAQLIDSGQQIPMDFVADKTTAASTSELQVSVIDPHGGSGGSGAGQDAQAGQAGQTSQDLESGASGTQTRGLDMVELTRYAVRQLYAPARLATRVPGVIQVQVAQVAVPALIRGVNADVAPLGAWKSGPLYVTAVRVTNRSRYPLEIPLEQLRGSWIAATAQHGRIGPAGSDTGTTVIYLVSSRPFEASL